MACCTAGHFAGDINYGMDAMLTNVQHCVQHIHALVNRPGEGIWRVAQRDTRGGYQLRHERNASPRARGTD